MITVTDTAAVKVKDLIEAEGEEGLALRVAVRPGGCSGFSYEMFFDAETEENDNLTTFGGVRVVVDSTSKQLLTGATLDYTVDYSGVKVVVDPSSAQLLEGATLDYKDGLNQAGFSINNPNAQRTCGCGQSFS